MIKFKRKGATNLVLWLPLLAGCVQPKHSFAMALHGYLPHRLVIDQTFTAALELPRDYRLVGQVNGWRYQNAQGNTFIVTCRSGSPDSLHQLAAGYPANKRGAGYIYSVRRDSMGVGQPISEIGKLQWCDGSELITITYQSSESEAVVKQQLAQVGSSIETLHSVKDK